MLPPDGAGLTLGDGNGVPTPGLGDGHGIVIGGIPIGGNVTVGIIPCSFLVGIRSYYLAEYPYSAGSPL